MTCRSRLMIMLLALCTSAWAQGHAPDASSMRIPAIAGGFPPLQEIAGVPSFHDQNLGLTQLPKPTGRRERLFNGKDLAQFTPWLGYANGSLFPADAADKPLGETGIGSVYQVVQEEGRPAIYISGRIWGALTTRRRFGNYHLSLWYKFRRQWGAEPPNSGVLYHSYGTHEDFAGTFMSSIEFEVRQGLTGMVATIGRGITAQVELGEAAGPGVFPGLKDFRYMPGGQPSEIRLPTMVKEARDVEKPVGQWNRIDLYVAGDQAVQVVNGFPTMALSKITLHDANGNAQPLTEGQIQLESEGTEIFMRDLWIEPIRSVPKVVVLP